MRTNKRYTKRRQSRKKSRKTKRTIKRNMRKYKGGDYPIDQMQQVPSNKYIPYGGNVIGSLDPPNISKGVTMSTFSGMAGGSSRMAGGGRKSRKVYKRRMLRRGGALMDIVPQQIVNSGRGVSSFVMDKFNGYQGYPEQASYLPYDQPIDSLNVAEVIRLY